ncbi:YCF48-related protein [Shewanella sp. 1_MG-2023]|uniref:WD40/YVTN/BNR-like repeat-containing protein n=1 Tax=unclassified Shewanella TaxID=196818 RepID=UPI001E4A8A18|nr:MULTISPECIES: YCF48-related protein [unclassified Shewanella]MCC4833356.1 YCF48-related protein [Shewanella sp. 10N.7]MDO6611810.1 YCF48-related protein [Shewanella sp. 7_MG-2023]MDO6771665.1 YCF48-related protein [Shewanella sp. 2_MG-2023]MDO6793891.1 YCF48-related protein [Shewanella sp. 1_MG-2023]
MSFRTLRNVVAISLGCLISTAPVHAQFDPLTVQIQPLAESSLVLDIAKAGENLVAVGERGHVLVKQQDWQQVSSPVISQLTKVFFLNEKQGWAVGHDATIIHTEDGGLTWQVQFQSTEVEKPLLDILFFNENEGIAVGAYGLFYRTADGGKNWVQEFHEELLFPEDVSYLADLKAEDEALYLSERSALLPHFNRVIQLADNRLLMVGELGLVATSDDNGVTFVTQPFDYEGSMFNAIETDAAVFVMGLRGHVFKTDKQFSQWQEIALPVKSSINNAYITDSGSLYLVGNAGVVIELDNTDTANIIARRQGENIVAIESDNQGQVWFAGSKGLFQLK